MNKEPETYEELIRKKRCIDLTKYYELSKDDLEQIYNFLEKNKDGQVRCGQQGISLIIGNDIANATVIMAKCISSSIDGILMSNQIFNVIPHYTPSSRYSSSGGSSSNNNNNNNKYVSYFR